MCTWNSWNFSALLCRSIGVRPCNWLISCTIKPVCWMTDLPSVYEIWSENNKYCYFRWDINAASVTTTEQRMSSSRMDKKAIKDALRTPTSNVLEKRKSLSKKWDDVCRKSEPKLEFWSDISFYTGINRLTSVSKSINTSIFHHIIKLKYLQYLRFYSERAVRIFIESIYIFLNFN